MTAVWGVLICSMPFILFAAGYYLGRYGLPIEIRRRKIQDRRKLIELDDDMGDDKDKIKRIEVYQ